MAEKFQVKYKKIKDPYNNSKEIEAYVPFTPQDDQYPDGTRTGIGKAMVVIYRESLGSNKGVVMVYNFNPYSSVCYKLQNNDHFWMLPQTDEASGNTIWVAAKNENHVLDVADPCSPLDPPVPMEILEGSQVICFGNRCYRI